MTYPTPRLITSRGSVLTLRVIGSVLMIFSIAMLSCEEVTIFAQRDRVEGNVDEKPITVGSCEESEDCPQWRCVIAECIEGECIPSRQGRARLSLEQLDLDQPLVSISMAGAQLFGIEGAPKEMAHPLSIGEGQSVLSWSLTAAPPQEEGDREAQRAYEEATWMPESKWAPQLEQVSLISSLNPDEEPEEKRELLALRGVTATADKIWLHAGKELRDLWWGKMGQSVSEGQYFRLAAPAQSLVVDGDEAWVSVFDKGIERLELSLEQREASNDELLSNEANARFNTPGRALNVRAGRSVVVVADGYAGISLFSKRGVGGLDQENVNRRLVTPPQELATQGRTVHLDLTEDRLISAELGLGVSVVRMNAAGGLEREYTQELGGSVRWVHWIDPYTAIVWVEGRGLLALDLLREAGGMTIMEERTLDSAGAQEVSAALWSASGQRYALLTPEGSLYHGTLSCVENL